MPTQVFPPPIARPQTPAMKRVVLNARRRPITSEAIPQNDAPMQSPTNAAQVVYLTLVVFAPDSSVD